MNYIYMYEGEFEKGEKGNNLIKRAANNYCLENKLPFNPMESPIKLEKGGKPYFTHIPIHFSITHSGRLWMCIISSKPCGIDVQLYKDTKIHEIAQRFFAEKERDYVKVNGNKGFFYLWTRKEAYGKMTGKGFFDSSLESVLEDSGTINDEMWEFCHIDIGKDIECCFCSYAGKSYELRVLR